jgi:hypothetical protein
MIVEDRGESENSMPAFALLKEPLFPISSMARGHQQTKSHPARSAIPATSPMSNTAHVQHG